MTKGGYINGESYSDGTISSSPTNETSDESGVKHKLDEERGVATQMAAVAATATKDTLSPSAVASYAKSISATIASLPLSHRNNGNSKAIYLHLVRIEIQRQLHEETKMSQIRNQVHNGAVEVIAEFENDFGRCEDIVVDEFGVGVKNETTAETDNIHDEIALSNSIRDNTVLTISHKDNILPEQCTNYQPVLENCTTNQSDLVKSIDRGNEDSILPHIIVPIDSGAKNGITSNIKPTTDVATIQNQTQISLKESNTKMTLAEKMLNETIRQFSLSRISQKRVANNQNDCFLKFLLLLNSYTCLVDDDNCNDQNKTVIKKHEQGRERTAAAFVISLLKSAENTYGTLLNLLPSIDQQNNLGKYESSLKQNLLNKDKEDFIPTNPTVHVILDLLPPCTSLSGDATSAFFRACSYNSNGERISSSRSDPLSPNQSPRISKHQTHVTSSSKTNVSGSTSIVGNVISSVTGKNLLIGNSSNAGSSSTIASVFGKVRKNSKQNISSSLKEEDQNNTSSIDSIIGSISQRREQSVQSVGECSSTSLTPDCEYTVVINREMLGLTVENVLERTVVRTVLPGGAAKKAGAKIGSLIVKVGTVETSNLTHFETIDELRQSQRPLKLVLRRVGKEALRGAREEMGRLIRGGGFGILGNSSDTRYFATSPSDKNHDWRPSEKGCLEKDTFTLLLHKHWVEGTKLHLNSNSWSRKDESLLKCGEKLVWILSLLVIGLDREAVSLNNYQSLNNSKVPCSPTNSRLKVSSSQRSSEDYHDAAKSVSKIIHDYVTNYFEEERKSPSPALDHSTPIPNRRKMKQLHPPPHVLSKQKGSNTPSIFNEQFNENKKDQNKSSYSESALLWIGDVLHRAQSFLTDPLSPPASLLRGEVISLLCDILDIDTEMALSEEESASSMVNQKAGAIADLGSAGSLLKLIVLNCSMMRSPECVIIAKELYQKVSQRDESHKAHAGNRFLAVVHRLAASRSTSARVTACSLGPVLWSHLDFAHQLQLRGVITRALHDVEVVVRKSTATVLHDIAELVFDARAVPWLVLMCERAMTDPEPQLRAAAMTLTWHLAEHLPNAFLGDASKGSRSLRRLPPRTDPTFSEVYLLQCKLLPVSTHLSEDRAASVRLAVAAQCDRLANALGEHWYSVIIDLLQALLADEDDRVRSEAVLCVPRLVEIVLFGSSGSASPSKSVSVLESLLPVTIKLSKDPSSSVRVSLATASGELLTLLVGLQSLDEIPIIDGTSSGNENGEQFTRYKRHIDDTLIPLVQRLLHDKIPEVTSAALRAVTNASRGNVREISSRRKERNSNNIIEDDVISISSHQSPSVERKEPVFIPVLSEKQVLRLLPTLSDLASSSQWRVRQSAVEIVPALLGCTHRLETRSEIAQLCVKLMADTVDAVRKTAAECLCLGGGSLSDQRSSDGGEWITAIVIPSLQTCRNSPDCKQRLLSLKMVEIILSNGVCSLAKEPLGNIIAYSETIETVSSTQLINRILTLAASLSRDKIANVRLNVGRVFENIISTLDENNLKFVIKVLEDQLSEEELRPGGGDRDVVYFSKRTIRAATDRLDSNRSSISSL